MYKLLIVDDEEIVRRSISKIIDWTSLGFSVVLQAENGLEALEIALKEKPDLILADIKMPFMDGLELSKIINEKLPSTSVVILSGHDEFNLAQKAIGLGVLDYILKPLGAASLTLKMQEIRKKLDERFKEKQYLTKIKDQLYQSLPLLRERYLNTLVCNPGGKEATEVRLRFLELPLDKGSYVVCAIEPDFGSIEAEDVDIYSFAMKNIVWESIGTPHLVFSDQLGRIIVLFSLSALSPEVEPRHMILEILSAIQKSIELFLDKSATFGIGTTVSSISELYFSYSEALAALECKYTLGKGRIYNIYDLDYRESEFIYPFDDFNEFLVHVKSCQTALLLADLAAISENLKSRKASPANIKIVFIQLVTELLKLLVETLEIPQETWSFGLSLYSKIDKLRTMDEIKEAILTFANKVVQCLSEAMTNSSKSLVFKAMEYIRNNYGSEDLSLDTTASHIAVSSGYLSALFKKESGINFSDYLTKIRMEKAMELLRTTDLKTYQIAYNIGFSNPHYFSISFKKHTGKTPSEFKGISEEPNESER